VPWECLEGIVPFLRSRTDWVDVGGDKTATGKPGTLDEHLKGCRKTNVARWVAKVLREAGVVQVVQGPLHVRLTEGHAR